MPSGSDLLTFKTWDSTRVFYGKSKKLFFYFLDVLLCFNFDYFSYWALDKHQAHVHRKQTRAGLKNIYCKLETWHKK